MSFIGLMKDILSGFPQSFVLQPPHEGPSSRLHLAFCPSSAADIEQYAKLAKENNALLILDVQRGRDTVTSKIHRAL
ncbi:hypothetical protein [Peribacillus kribbensis]|uniref:hypothetical protein n=1 Tax=Peribacillus kribbensis TaxID=356658 RepID=UPI00047C810E|nr:hypothetical protein [Peribacillus kribbensis]